MAKQDWVSVTEAMKIANVKHRMIIWRRCETWKREGHALKVGETWMIDRAAVIRYGEYYHSPEFEDSEDANSE